MYIGRSFDLYGEFSELELKFIEQFLKPGQLILDIGANIGSHTLFFAQKFGNQCNVLAFEPQRLVFQNLCANLALNGLTNVHALNVALGETPGMIRVPALNFNTENNFGGLNIEGHEVGDNIPLITIDSLNLSRCDFMKIDVEGMEESVLKGAKETIEKFKPIIYLENDRPNKSQALITYITSLGYQLHWHKPPLFNPDNFFQNPNNIFGEIVSLNMICTPQ